MNPLPFLPYLNEAVQCVKGDLDSVLLAEQAQNLTIGSGRPSAAKVCDFLFERGESRLVRNACHVSLLIYPSCSALAWNKVGTCSSFVPSATRSGLDEVGTNLEQVPTLFQLHNRAKQRFDVLCLSLRMTVARRTPMY